MSDQERKQYEYDMDTLVRDTDVIKTQLLEAEIEGRKKGLEEGRKEGRKEGLLDTAKNLKAMGLPDEDIAYATGLSLDEVKKLQ